MTGVRAAVAGLLASIFAWTSAGAIESNVRSRWDGYYVGMNAGYIYGVARWTDTLGFTTGDFSGTGVMLGLTAGKNWQSGRWVYGIEGDVSLAELLASSGAFTCILLDCRTSLTGLGTLRLRAGYLVTPDILFFGTGGLAVGKFTHGNVLFDSAKNTGAGFALGAGVEARVAPRWTLKAEYLFTRLNGGNTCFLGLCAIDVENDKFDAHVFRLGLNWHFNQSNAPQAPAVRPSSWTGFYAGLFIGHAQVLTEWSDPSFNAVSGEFEGKNMIGGVNAGFNWQNGRWIYGVEGDAAFMNIKATSSTSICLCFPADTEISYLFTLRGRVGYLVTPDTLLFATGGVAIAPMKFGNFFLQTGSDVDIGPALGAGIEVQAFKDWTIKSEYLFTSFGSQEACGALLCLGALYSDYIRIHTVRFALNRYF